MKAEAESRFGLSEAYMRWGLDLRACPVVRGQPAGDSRKQFKGWSHWRNVNMTVIQFLLRYCTCLFVNLGGSQALSNAVLSSLMG